MVNTYHETATNCNFWLLSLQDFGHLLSTPLRAISWRFSGERVSARALPPALPPAARPGALDGLSSISPVAIRPTMTAAELVSAGRRTPLGPFGTATALLKQDSQK